MDAAERHGSPEPRDVEQGATPEAPMPRRQRSTLPTFLFMSFILFMLTNNQNEELMARNQYMDALSILNGQLSNFTAWVNGTESNFTLPTLDASTIALRQQLITFGTRVDPQLESYYANMTGFWKGDLHFHNLTSLNETAQVNSSLIRPWSNLATDFIVGANISNTTEFTTRLGPWNWTRSEKVDISLGDKLVWSKENNSVVSKDIAMLRGKIDFTDPESSDEFRLEIDGVHFIKNGSIYAFAEPSGKGIDIRNIVSLVPAEYMNATARVVGVDMANRIAKLKEKIDQGAIEENPNDEGPKSGCSFQFYGQLEHSDIPQPQLQEVEDEIEHPTGISTVHQPKMVLKAVLMSKNCAMVYELPEIKGMKSNTLYRKITTYSGVSTLMYIVLLVLFFRQVSRSRSVTGLSRVSRYPFLIQSLVDAVSFVGHVTLAIIADGRTSVSVLAPAALSCILFVEEAQFAILIGQIQAPEDVRKAVRGIEPDRRRRAGGVELHDERTPAATSLDNYTPHSVL
ncbi:hypothetical protein NM688_g4952 [Phlebia brevispora]|uniref:Uncharacterized protein n=1 Tax=Phlebia brevispora TaxID=194682 RepID=A0ACC1T173_9APHY|nr:hypothetical protein NM688_g4952 [Phlebia brevispora]